MWERFSRSTSTKDCKRQDKQRRETSTIEGTGDQVRVIFEEARFLVSEEILDEEASAQLTQDDAGLRLVVWDVAGELEELGQVDLVESEALDFGIELRHSVSGEN
jgi:hypothetical protein